MKRGKDKRTIPRPPTIPPVVTDDVSLVKIQMLLSRLAACTQRREITWDRERTPRDSGKGANQDTVWVFTYATRHGVVKISPDRFRLFDERGTVLRDANYRGVDGLYDLLVGQAREAEGVIASILAELDELAEESY